MVLLCIFTVWMPKLKQIYRGQTVTVIGTRHTWCQSKQKVIAETAAHSQVQPILPNFSSILPYMSRWKQCLLGDTEEQRPKKHENKLLKKFVTWSLGLGLWGVHQHCKELPILILYSFYFSLFYPVISLIYFMPSPAIGPITKIQWKWSSDLLNSSFAQITNDRKRLKKVPKSFHLSPSFSFIIPCLQR